MSGPGNNQNAESELWVYLFGALLTGFVLFGLDYVFGDAYLYFSLHVRALIAWFMHLLTGAPQYDGLVSFVTQTGYGDFSWVGAIEANSYLGPFFRIAVALPFIAVAAYLYKLGSGKYDRVMSIQQFIELQSQIFWQIAPIVHDDPMKDKSGKWAFMQSPTEFAHSNEILFRASQKGGAYHFSNEKARVAFDRQLTPKPASMADLPLYQLLMFAGFVCQAQGKVMAESKEAGFDGRKACDAFLEALARSYASNQGVIDGRVFKHKVLASTMKDLGFPNTAEGVVECLTKGRLSKVATQIWRRHAQTESVMVAALHEARLRGGVRATADFIWVRPVNRPLWYTLNNLGRRSFLVEGAAGIYHYNFEVASKRPVSTKQIEAPVRALAGALRRDGINHTGEG